MNFLERLTYSFIFLLNKYINSDWTEHLLNSFENKMINKYVNRIERVPEQIPTINAEDLTDEKFIKLSNNYRDPVLIKGLMKDSMAVKKWNLEYLNDVIGDFKINTIKFVDKFEIDNIAFSDFVSKLDENWYINNNHTILSAFPELFNDVEPEFNYLLNQLKSCNLKNVHIANLFIGYNDENKPCSGSSLHCGGSGNFFCMLNGYKHWTLIDPSYSCLLKGRIAESGIHAQTLFDMADMKIDDTPTIFKYLPRYEIYMEPGDVLYNAPWWWHRIKNDNGLSIGMAIRNNKVTKLNLLNNFTYTLSGYTYLVYNTLMIEFYERYLCDKNFTSSKTENSKSDVLYQIEKLISKYPKSLDIEKIN